GSSSRSSSGVPVPNGASIPVAYRLSGDSRNSSSGVSGPSSSNRSADRRRARPSRGVAACQKPSSRGRRDMETHLLMPSANSTDQEATELRNAPTVAQWSGTADTRLYISLGHLILERVRRLTAIDLFCGAGGSSWGARLGGVDVVAG